MSLKNIYARIPQHLLEKLSALAEERNQSTSQLIREIVCAFLEPVKQVDNGTPVEYREPDVTFIAEYGVSLDDESVELDW